MTRDGCFSGYGDGAFGRTMPRIMWNHAHWQDRVPDFWPLPDAAPALPIMAPLSEPAVATTVIVLTEAERTLIA